MSPSKILFILSSQLFLLVFTIASTASLLLASLASNHEIPYKWWLWCETSHRLITRYQNARTRAVCVMRCSLSMRLAAFSFRLLYIYTTFLPSYSDLMSRSSAHSSTHSQPSQLLGCNSLREEDECVDRRKS